MKQAIHRHIKGEEPLFSEPAVANLLNSGLGTAAAAASRGGWRRANYRGRLQGPRHATSRPAGRHFCAKYVGLNHPLSEPKQNVNRSRQAQIRAVNAGLQQASAGESAAGSCRVVRGE